MKTNILKSTTGERLVQLREKFGLSQAQVASSIGVDRTSYAKYEKNVNKPTRKLKELSELFHVTTDYIMCLSEHPYGTPFAGQDNGHFLVFDYQIFAIRLKKLCQKNKITQEELEKISGVSLQVIEDWEHCKRMPDDPTMAKLASFFNVSVDYLLGRTDEPGGSVSNAGVTESRPLYDSGIKIMNELIRIEDSLKKLTAKESTGIKDVYVDIANKLYDIEFELFRAEDQYHNRKLMEKEQKIVFALKVQQLMKENNISEAAASEIVAETQKNQYELNIRQAFNESRKFTLSSIAALVNIQDIEKSIASSTISGINKLKQQIQAFQGFKNNAFHPSEPSVEDLKILDTAFFRKLYEDQKYDNQYKILPEMFWLPDFIKGLKSAANRPPQDFQLALSAAKSTCLNTWNTIKIYNKSPM